MSLPVFDADQSVVKFTDESLDDLTSLIEKDFGSLPKDEKSKGDAFYAWLHYRARLIPERPRRVVFSDEVNARLKTYGTIGNIAAALRIGADVAPWLSERVRRRRQDIKADLMFNDWQVSHFHLGTVFDRPQRVKRGDPLLFAFVNAERAVLLDVQPHGAWSMQNLLRILLRVSPADMNTELRGILPGPPCSDTELVEMRTAGLATPITLDGRAFMPPGIGIASSGAAVRITQFGDNIWRMLNQVRSNLENNTLPQRQMSTITSRLGVPVCLGLAFGRGIFCAYEKNRRLALMETRPLA